MNTEAINEVLSHLDPRAGAEIDFDTIKSDLKDCVDRDVFDRETVAHFIWTHGGWLKHKGCRNNPKRGADADYSNGCETCEVYLCAVADSIILASGEPDDLESHSCDRGTCYLGNGHEGECEPGPSLRPQSDDLEPSA